MSFSQNHLKAVIFDFDGTLAVLNIDFGLMRGRVFEWMNSFGVAEERIKEKYLLEIIDEVYCLLMEEGNASRAERFYHRAHQILQTVEFEAAGEGRLIPGSKETLAFIRERGIKVGIVTRNCEEAVRRVFPNINDYCDAFVSRDSVKRVKPHPDHLVSVMKALKVSEKEAVMIGDHVLDIQAGERVGMKTVAVLTGRIKKEEFEKAGADYILGDVSELCELLEDKR